MSSLPTASAGRTLNLIGLSFAPHSNVGDIRSLGLGFLKSPRRLSSGLGNQARGLDLWGIGEQRGRCVLVRSLRSRRSERGQNGFRMPHPPPPYPHLGNRREEGVAPSRVNARTRQPRSAKI